MFCKPGWFWTHGHFMPQTSESWNYCHAAPHMSHSAFVHLNFTCSLSMFHVCAVVQSFRVGLSFPLLQIVTWGFLKDNKAKPLCCLWRDWTTTIQWPITGRQWRWSNQSMAMMCSRLLFTQWCVDKNKQWGWFLILLTIWQL